MAKHSQDREDLLRDATAFVDRVQVTVPEASGSITVFAGFRTSGALSVYFDQDPVYHFKEHGELRRAYVDDSLVKAEQGRLIALRRERGDSEVAMVRHELDSDEQMEFCKLAAKRLGDLRVALQQGDFALEGQVTVVENENVVDRLVVELKQLSDITIADSPRVVR